MGRIFSTLLSLGAGKFGTMVIIGILSLMVGAIFGLAFSTQVVYRLSLKRLDEENDELTENIINRAKRNRTISLFLVTAVVGALSYFALTNF